jgi:hypothetical protein
MSLRENTFQEQMYKLTHAGEIRAICWIYLSLQDPPDQMAYLSSVHG